MEEVTPVFQFQKRSDFNGIARMLSASNMEQKYSSKCGYDQCIDPNPNQHFTAHGPNDGSAVQSPPVFESRPMVQAAAQPARVCFLLLDS